MRKKLILAEIIDASKSIDALKSMKGEGVPGSLVMRTRRILKPFVSEITEYEELHGAKIRELGKTDESDSGRVVLAKGTVEYALFVSYINELVNSEVVIDVKETIDIKELENIKSSPLSSDDFDHLITLGIVIDSYEPVSKPEDCDVPDNSESDGSK